jgi:16S rRNA (guanine527-N7)-methyltransferase
VQPQDRAYLQIGARSLGVPLDDTQLDRLAHYVDLLLSWNDKVNLTAVTEPRAIVDKHLLDSLAIVPALNGRQLLDVGTGAGLPSVVLAIARPELLVTAIDSIQKKVAFVRTVSRELRLPIRVEAIRLENLPIEARFDVAVSRATFEPTEWVARGAPFVRSGGRLIAMLSSHQDLPYAPPGFAAPLVTEHDLGGALRRLAVFKRG